MRSYLQSLTDKENNHISDGERIFGCIIMITNICHGFITYPPFWTVSKILSSVRDPKIAAPVFPSGLTVNGLGTWAHV
jgi:hypothetical protein